MAGDNVVQRIAGTVGIKRPAEREIFNEVRQGVVAPNVDQVNAAHQGIGLNHDIVGVDRVGVVAITADQGIDQAVVAAGQGVVQGVAGQGGAGTVERVHLLDIRIDGPTDAGEDTVPAGSVVALVDHVSRVVDVVSIVVDAAGHAVNAGAAVEYVVAVTADQRVVAAVADECIRAAVAGDQVGQRIAGAIDRRETSQREVFDVGPASKRTRHRA